MKGTRGLVVEAQRLARAEGAERASSAHLVLAALELPDGTAGRCLVTVGATPSSLRDALEEEVAASSRNEGHPGHPGELMIDVHGPVPGPPIGIYACDASAQRLVADLIAEASSLRCRQSGALVLRVASLHDRTTAGALRRMGIHPQALADSASIVVADHRRVTARGGPR